MPQRVDWFLGHPSSKEGTDLLYPRNKHSKLANGQIFNKCHRGAAIIAVSIAGVRNISSEIVRGPRSLILGKALLKETRIRARSR
jgi:hypothetical protein